MKIITITSTYLNSNLFIPEVLLGWVKTCDKAAMWASPAQQKQHHTTK